MRAIWITVVVVLMSGCSIFMRSIEKPSAKVRDVSVSSATLGSVTGELSLDVTNPNPIGVPLSSIEWQLEIGGARALTGSVQLSKTIPARGVAPVTTSLTIAAADAIRVAQAMAGGARDYRLHAKLTFSTAVGAIDVQVQHAGQLSSGGVLGGAGALAPVADTLRRL